MHTYFNRTFGDSDDQIKDEMGGICGTYLGKEKYRVLVGKPERMRSLGKIEA
jgi:hypothetical protein